MCVCVCVCVHRRERERERERERVFICNSPGPQGMVSLVEQKFEDSFSGNDMDRMRLNNILTN